MSTYTDIKDHCKELGITLMKMDNVRIKALAFKIDKCLEMEEVMEDEGVVKKNQSGHGEASVKHPAVTVYKELSILISQEGTKYGLTPKDRKDLMQGVQLTKKNSFDLKRKAV